MFTYQYNLTHLLHGLPCCCLSRKHQANEAEWMYFALAHGQQGEGHTLADHNNFLEWSLASLW